MMQLIEEREIMARRSRKGRNVSGILVLDKPAGITSNAALQQVKRLFDARKAGHTGSLDPLATGVLPLCFGGATRFSQFLLDADKHYRVRIHLGIATDSGDADGQVLAEKPVPEFSDKQVETCLEKYRGEIAQVPSMYSALKVDGQPLYKLARQGIEVERQARPVKIYQLEILHRSREDFSLDLRCSKGTYVRSLAEDIGRDLGCGAHVAELRRLAAGPFQEEEALTISQLESLAHDRQALDATMLPVSAAVRGWTALTLTQVTASYLKQGQPVQVAKAPAEGWVSIFAEGQDAKPEFIGVGEILDDGRVAPRKLIAAE